MPFTVERIRVKLGETVPDGIVIELGSPNSYKIKRDVWSQRVSPADWNVNELTMAVIRGGWIAFKRQGETKVWSEILLEEAGNCRTLGAVSTEREIAPFIVKSYFDAAERSEKAAAASSGPNSKPGGGPLTEACMVLARRMTNFTVAPLRAVTTDDGAYFQTGANIRQLALDQASTAEKVMWAAAAKIDAAWAVYNRTNGNGGDRIEAQYLFANAGGCAAYPQAVAVVGVLQLPDEVVQHFLDQAGMDTTGTTSVIHGRLQGMLEKTPPSAQPSKQQVPPPPIATDKGGEPEMLAGENLAANVKSLPPPILRQLLEWQRTCKDKGEADASIDDQFVTRIDIDGDGRTDYLTNGDHVYCLLKDGDHSMIGGGNGATVVTIVMSTPLGPVEVANLMAQYGQLYRYDGYSVFASGRAHPEKMSFLLLRRGKSQKIEGKPKGGEQVYALSR